jgi:hypothetical protein
MEVRGAHLSKTTKDGATGGSSGEREPKLGQPPQNANVGQRLSNQLKLFLTTCRRFVVLVRV